MLRLIAYTLLFTVLGLAGMWLSENPGQFALTWLGWRIDASASAMLVGMVVLGALSIAIYSALRLPWRLKAHRKQQHMAQGLRALTHSMVALSAGDMKDAKGQLKSA